MKRCSIAALRLMLAITLFASGCSSCPNPVSSIPDDAVGRCAALPQACRNHVYIFLICGQGPFDLGDLGSLRESLISLGYIKTYCGECCYSGYYKNEILRLHQQDASARFVVVGYGLGANTAADLAQAVQPDGATIDLLAYCGGVTISNDPKYRPSNALRVVHLLSGGIDSIGDPLDGADNIQLSDATHFETATHPFTMELLVRELTEAASRVQVVEPNSAAESTTEQGPAPRANSERESMPRDDWDFLKPSQPNSSPAPKSPPLSMPKVL